MNLGRSNTRAILLMLGASVSFAMMAAGAKYCSRRLPVAEIVLVRSVLSTLLLWLWMIRSGASWTGYQPGLLLSRAVVGFTAMMLYFWCLSQIDLGTAVMLNYTAPIFAVVIAQLFFRERSDRSYRWLLAASFAGVVLLSSPQIHFKPLALGAGLLSGLLAGVVHLLIRGTHSREHPLTIVHTFTVVSALGSAALIGLEPLVAPTAGEWAALGLVTVGSLFGQLGLTYSLRGAPVSVVSPFGYFTPVFGLVLGGIFWAEIPSAMGLAGGALIILCGALLYRKQTRFPVSLGDG